MIGNNMSSIGSTKKIQEKVVSYRLVGGTDFPVFDQLLRQEWNGKVHWQIIRGLCNGVPDSGKRYSTLKEATQEF